MNKNYGGVIWTNHAMERLRDRNISQGDAFATFRRPHAARKGSAPDSYVYYRTFGHEKIEVVAKKTEKKEWLILSVWSRPIFGGTSLTFWQQLKRLFGLY